MVKYKDITQKLKEYEEQKYDILEKMQKGELSLDQSNIALTLIKEVGTLYEAVQGRKANEDATKADERRFGLVCTMFDELNGVKTPTKKGIDELLG